MVYYRIQSVPDTARFLRKGADKMVQKALTGYPSVDKPWLKYYSEEAANAPLPECTAYELLQRGNEGHSDDVALIYFDRKITYGQLLDGIEKAARAFAALGVRRGDIVIMCVINMPETVYALYALDRLGAVANMVDPRTNASQLRDYISECEAKFAVTVGLAYPVMRQAAKGTGVEKIVVTDPADSLPPLKRMAYRLKNRGSKPGADDMRWAEFISLGAFTTPEYAPYEKDRCFLIAHTGGTTGIPKGVMLSDDNINAVAHGYKYIDIPFERQQKYFDDLPPFIVYGLSLAIHTALCYGLQVILYPIFSPREFPKLFRKYKPNHFCDVADHFRYLTEDPLTADMKLPFLITAGVGGDTLNSETESVFNDYLRRNGCRYKAVKGYGMTELCATGVTAFGKANAIGSVGVPFAANTVKIVDMDTGRELGYDKTGEIWISAPSAMLGYYKKPNETAEVVVTDENGKRWVKTGDLGRINTDGLVFHEGRIRRIYLTAFDGQPAKIFPGLIESAVRELPDVYDCTAVARFMPGSTCYEPVAYVILHTEHMPMDAVMKELHGICAERLPTYMQPVEYRFVTEFPKTTIGKVDYRTLERMAAENTSGR